MIPTILYKYINCTVDKLLALALLINYVTNYNIIIITTTTTTTTIIIMIMIITITTTNPPRPGNTGLMSNGDSLISWGERSSLALVGNPSRDGVSIEILLWRHLKLNLQLL